MRTEQTLRRTRSERMGRLRADRRRLYAAVGMLAAGVIVLGAAGAWAMYSSANKAPAASPPLPSAKVVVEETAPAAMASLPMEVPTVEGEPLAQAEILLTHAGFQVERREAATAGPCPDRSVLSQDPASGTLAERGAVVVLVHSPAPSPGGSGAPAKAAIHKIVCIDAGHQQRSDQRPEPIGPGSSQTKMRVTGGTTGVQTGRPEYVLTLDIAERVRTRLEAAGVQVVMTRTKHDVSISNAERAQIANRAGADLFLRIHADGNTDRSVRGVSTLRPARNVWTAPIVERSLTAARAVHRGVLDSTAAPDRGIHERDDITGFNWSSVPTLIVECGFLSNPQEDALLATPAYQEKVAEGIAKGVLAYLRGG